jgi:hypothetical protein
MLKHFPLEDLVIASFLPVLDTLENLHVDPLVESM